MSVHPTAFAHETAIVEDGASIGADTKVWHIDGSERVERTFQVVD